jgi:mannose-6-phosphate isomerase-like protein (cupin superfamily)
VTVVAYAGKVIESPTTRLVFGRTAADTDGELLSFEQFVRGGTPEVPEHIHPRQEECFVVVSGRMGVRAAGREHILGAGEEVVVPPGTPHTFWNAGEEELHHVVELRPALEHEAFFETVFGLQRNGRFPVEGEGRPPNPLQGALLVLGYGNYLAKPPIPVQRALFGPLVLLGRLLGYGNSYPEYSDDRPERSEDER